MQRMAERGRGAMWPSARIRTVLTMAVMGWWLAKACIQPGIVDTGT